MKTHYASSLASYIDSSFSAGLNLLCYRCKTKCYLVHDGYDRSEITGGWNTYLNGSGSHVTFHSYTFEDYYCVTKATGATACKAMATTKNKLDLSGYSYMYALARGIDDSYGEAGRFGVSTTSGFTSSEETNLNVYKNFNGNAYTTTKPSTYSVNISSITTGYYVKLCSALWGGSNGNRTALWKNVYLA